MAETGRIIQFNAARGYGFISPDGGGDDVFIHVAELKGSADDVRVGTRIRYEVMESQRGSKAYDAVILDTPRISGDMPDPDDDLSEVLTTGEYSREITDVLIAVSPAVTAAQIVEIRDRLVKAARRRGWLED